MSGQTSDGSWLPVTIDDAETIVRAVVAPSHFDKKGRVRPAAFRPPAGKSALSVMRQLMGDDFCKAKSAEIGNKSPGQSYKGMLVIKAAAIRATVSTVTDSRDIWLGHADLDHGFESVRDEPLASEAFARMTERCYALKQASTYHQDPAPDEVGWSGPTLNIG